MSKKIIGDEYKDIFYYSPAAKLIIDVDAPVYSILDVNQAYLATTNSSREALIGQSVFEAFPANPTDQMSKNIERTIYSFEQAIRTRKPHTMSNYRYDIPVRGTDQFEERYWTTTNTPIMDQDGRVKYLIHSPENVTSVFKLAEREKAGVEALKRQREQLHSFFMQAPVGIGIFKGPEYIVDLINPTLCELYGKTMEEMLGQPVFDVLEHAKGQGFEELVDKVVATGIPFRGEAFPVPLIRNGKLENVYVNFVYEPFRELDGTISGIIAVATDVTEQVQTKQQLEEAEERVRLAVDAVGIGTYDFNMETGELITSELFARIFGFDKPMPRQEYIKAFHPDDMEIRQKAHELALKTGKLSYEARVIWPDQSIHWTRIEGKLYFNSKGKPARIIGTTLDITEHKQNKEQQQRLVQLIADNEQLLKNITSATPTGLWMTDEAGATTYVNQTWIDWIGLPYKANLGFGWLDAVLQEDKKKAKEAFLNGLSHKKRIEFEFRIHHTDGSVHWCVATGKPQYRADGSFSGYIGACVDITDQKHLQQQKDDFIGIASHELKTPVTSIKAYTQVLEKMLLKQGRVKEASMINKMDVQLNRLTSLIGDLLDVTKITTGKLQFNDRNFDFNELTNELIEDLQRTTEKHTLVKEISPTGIVYGDRERIGQVITNLITNAIKYSPDSDKIIIRAGLKNDEVNLCVQDFGIGISSANLDKVFEQFYRVSGDRQHTFPGLGLGLFISSEIIKREGGRIWVSSVEGEGSIFCFALPLSNQTTSG